MSRHRTLWSLLILISIDINWMIPKPLSSAKLRLPWKSEAHVTVKVFFSLEFQMDVIFCNLLCKLYLLQSTLICEQGPSKGGPQMLNSVKSHELETKKLWLRERLFDPEEELGFSQMGQWWGWFWKGITTFIPGGKTHVKMTLWNKRDHETLNRKINTHLHLNSCKLSTHRRLTYVP